MNELRVDGVTGQEVIIVPGRASRPVTAVNRINSPSDRNQVFDNLCPFCPGNESQTPPEIFRRGDGDPDTPGWKVRVVPNLYPIVDDSAGAHEVVVLSPAHNVDFGGLSDDEAAAVLLTTRARAKFHNQAGRAHTQIFINQGRLAGASIEHPHAQITALNIVPPLVLAEISRMNEAQKNTVSEDALMADDQDGTITTKGQIRAWCPLGSTSSYLIRIGMARANDATEKLCFEDTSDELIKNSAIVLRDTLSALEKVLGVPDYNVVLHSPPAGDYESNYSWWLEIIPRVSVLGGFEFSTGIFVNTIDPVVAAAALRENL